MELRYSRMKVGKVSLYKYWYWNGSAIRRLVIQGISDNSPCDSVFSKEEHPLNR